MVRQRSYRHSVHWAYGIAVAYSDTNANPYPHSNGHRHSHANRNPCFNTRRDSYADTDAKEGTREGPWEGPSASFAYANSLITSSTSTPTRIAIRTQGSSTMRNRNSEQQNFCPRLLGSARGRRSNAWTGRRTSVFVRCY